MMIIASWNIRGFHLPHKQDDVRRILNEHGICLMGILETKITPADMERIIVRKFNGWCYTHNFDLNVACRILVLWDPNSLKI